MTDPQLAAALSHSTRVHILSVVNTRLASPKELAAELGEPVPNINYHVGILLELGCIELAEVEPRHGSRVSEHFYRAKKLQYLDDAAWEQLELQGKWEVVIPIMRLISRDVNEAMEQGTFLDPDDNHLTRTPMIVDPEGWEETKVILAEALDRLLEVKDNVKDRAEAGQEAETMAIKVELIQFRSPDRDKEV
jgi:DNA-binding transcriptional ArsR family regulator